MIYAIPEEVRKLSGPPDEAERTSRSTCIKIPVEGYVVSVALDNSCGVMSVLGRGNICIFKDDVDVTSECFTEHADANAENLLKALMHCTMK